MYYDINNINQICYIFFILNYEPKRYNLRLWLISWYGLIRWLWSNDGETIFRQIGWRVVKNYIISWSIFIIKWVG